MIYLKEVTNTTYLVIIEINRPNLDYTIPASTLTIDTTNN
jgi:hypothetical protein